MAKVPPIPPGFTALTPYLIVDGADRAIAFYQKAFGAVDLGRLMAPDGKKVLHAMLRIGDAFLMLNDEFPDMGAVGPKKVGGTPVIIHHYVTDVDATMAAAVAAGATVAMPAADMFWGDRFGKLVDPFGHHWSIATHIADVPPDQMAEAARKAMGG